NPGHIREYSQLRGHDPLDRDRTAAPWTPRRGRRVRIAGCPPEEVVYRLRRAHWRAVANLDGHVHQPDAFGDEVERIVQLQPPAFYNSTGHETRTRAGVDEGVGRGDRCRIGDVDVERVRWMRRKDDGQDRRFGDGRRAGGFGRGASAEYDERRE